MRDQNGREGEDPGASKPKTRKCPICGKPTDEVMKPFCSKRCADVDLHRWFGGVYAVPVEDDSLLPGEDEPS